MVVSSKGKSSKELNKKELMFCHYYINTGDSKEAAVRAGYKTFPNKKGTELLLDKIISERIESMYREKRKNLVYRATSGYERLAFGSISDSIKLLFSENLRPEDLEKMDLFNIICGVCSIAGLLVSVFTAGNVVKIAQTVNSGNVDDHSKVVNKGSRNTYNGPSAGRDLNGTGSSEQK